MTLRSSWLLLVLAGCGGEPPGLSVMSFNVLCSFCDPTYDLWEERLPAFANIFRRHAPDLIGLQEIALRQEVDDVLGPSSRYEAIFFDGDEAYPDATIFYDRARFELREEGHFWLSPTPDEPFSTGFAEGRQLARLVVWARLFDREADAELHFATTHFDNNTPSQARSAPLVVERLRSKTPLVFVGDFNSQPADEAFSILTEHFADTHALAAEVTLDYEEPTAPAYDPADRIDHVFVDDASKWEVERWSADLYRYGEEDRLPSDHRAIAVRMRWR